MSTPPPVWPPQPGSPSPYGAPQSTSNATLILVLGILSIVCIPILGPVAWILGNNALASGTVPPAQIGQVNAGRICGMIGSALIILGIIYWIVIFGVLGTSALHHPGGFSPTPVPAPTSSP
jgi:hypothetical protein